MGWPWLSCVSGHQCPLVSWVPWYRQIAIQINIRLYIGIIYINHNILNIELDMHIYICKCICIYYISHIIHMESYGYVYIYMYIIPCVCNISWLTTWELVAAGSQALAIRLIRHVDQTREGQGDQTSLQWQCSLDLLGGHDLRDPRETGGPQDISSANIGMKGGGDRWCWFWCWWWLWCWWWSWSWS